VSESETSLGHSFSAATRHVNLERLGREEFDLLVVGGGITGVATARDASLRGFRTALVDKGDFGCGTSSRSTRLIHGGIRYLEYGEFKLVFNACSERRVMRRIAPRLVRPLPFLYPIYRGQQPSSFKIRAGMVLYDALSLFRNVQNHRWLRPAEVQRREPLVAGRGLLSAGRYYDAQVNRMARAYRRRRAEMESALVAHGLLAAPLGSRGGSSIWLRAPEGIDTTEAAEDLLADGVVIEPGRVFFGPDDDDRAHYRLSYSSIQSSQIREGIRLLAARMGKSGHNPA